MKLSARNQIKGKIVKIEQGAVNAVVILDVGGGNQISATITMDSVKSLALREGDPAYAVFKASSVMIGTDE